MPLDFKKIKATISRPSGPSRVWHRVEREDNFWLAWYWAPLWGEKEKKNRQIFYLFDPVFCFFPLTMKPSPRLTYDWCFGGRKQLSSNQRLEKCNQFNCTFSGCLLKIKINWCYQGTDKKPNLFPRNFHSTGSWTLHRVLLTHINVFLK